MRRKWFFFFRSICSIKVKDWMLYYWWTRKREKNLDVIRLFTLYTASHNVSHYFLLWFSLIKTFNVSYIYSSLLKAFTSFCTVALKSVFTKNKSFYFYLPGLLLSHIGTPYTRTYTYYILYLTSRKLRCCKFIYNTYLILEFIVEI